ncbi:PREDICTED: adenylate isopentenyltransferase 3, chloroplastic-like [Ipomoea nil]|uniref:adenylate isopentenyltransferase 3, chloroplastic-like n=1 Tax=Ipomoea nil TaxID=35883 RepID=UPI000901BDA2|nr:PREDICTED: adenylate isopentenyltransferase 3, chloroplastic-like [Ipomoea nil]
MNRVYRLKMAMNMNKKVVVFIMGATGSGKSKLSISLAAGVGGEIINSDKIQVYRGLDVLSNKVTEAEMQGVPHHLLSGADPDVEFTAGDFCLQATAAIEKISGSGKLPIVVGGSNSFIEALVEDPISQFKSTYRCCFIWLDACPLVLGKFVSERVDQMVEQGLVEEVRGIFDPDCEDYTKGIRKAIGVPELDEYLRAEINKNASEVEKTALLKAAITQIKLNTISLIYRQVEKIKQLNDILMWPIHRIDVTPVFQVNGDKEAQEVNWEMLVFKPSLGIVEEYLKNI